MLVFTRVMWKMELVKRSVKLYGYLLIVSILFHYLLYPVFHTFPFIIIKELVVNLSKDCSILKRI